MSWLILIVAALSVAVALFVVAFAGSDRKRNGLTAVAFLIAVVGIVVIYVTADQIWRLR